LGACLSAILGIGSYLFHRGDRRSVELAARLVPFNSEYLSRLSSYRPAERTELLRKAAAADPYSEQVWLQLGFDAEFYHHDYSAAERYYLKAAEVSHLFLPRWTLTNFYFRRQNRPEFLKWSRAALQVTPYTADPIFTEMWLMDPDHSTVAADIPNRPAILQQYFEFLMTARQFAAVPPIVKRLVASAPVSQAHLYGLDNDIGPALDTLLGAGYGAEAILIWNDLFTAHWIQFPTPTPEHPLTNGDFATLFGHGFDWFLLHPSGVSLTYNEGVHEIAIDFSGDEPEQCEILQQWIPLGPSRSYHLQWKQQTAGLNNPAGLTWRVHASTFDLQSPDLLDEQGGGWTLQTPPGANIAILMLEYRRPLGQTKAQGTLQLQSVMLQPN
jgi:tetratricopeptide (TPR) repeat protein